MVIVHFRLLSIPSCSLDLSDFEHHNDLGRNALGLLDFKNFWTKSNTCTEPHPGVPGSGVLCFMNYVSKHIPEFRGVGSYVFVNYHNLNTSRSSEVWGPMLHELS